jgi:Rrf2 family transcriptional regulator, nitric oxide-sensitive transcriptional repressor
VKFRLQTDYALRALTYLAAKGHPATTDEIAAHYAISSAHLGRVIRRLQAMGYMKAVRGRKGGVRLAREPQTLTLGEVVCSLEDNGQLMDGLHPGESAGAYMGRLAAVLRRAAGTFTAYLARVTFSELAADGLGPASAPSAAMEQPFVVAEKLEPVPAGHHPGGA